MWSVSVYFRMAGHPTGTRNGQTLAQIELISIAKKLESKGRC